MSVDWKTYALPDRIDAIPGSDLHAFLLANQTSAVRLSAAALRRVDTRLLQYLIVVARDWATRKLDFVLSDVAAPQAAVMALIGVTPDVLPWQEAGA